VQFFDFTFGVLRFNRVATEHILCTVNQPLLPVLDLIRVDIELFGQFRQGLVTAHCRQCYLGLEAPVKLENTLREVNSERGDS
jgi:hypothetical protein